ncbi:MAG: 1-acyl-sn-glycerol-3-phosphate acyltransferase [Deltaproteobacteria bacterium]|nr:1-acyl-sn-glycerol-3-phosphate acyltransferase [Deltaproteobacteria bacterium]
MSRLRSLIGAVYGAGVLLGAIASAAVIGTALALPFAPIPRGRRERYTLTAAVLWARSVLCLLGARLVVTGESGLAPDEGALVLCNHRSWLDPVALIVALRSNGLSKREILWIPVIGLYGWLAGAVFFDRRDRAARQRARDDVLALIRGGARIQVFPEGTRSRDGRLSDKVYLTLAGDCYRAGHPVVPCAVWGTERALPVGVPVAWPGQTVCLDVGAALRPASFASEEAFVAACWDAVVRRVRRFEEAVPGAGLEPAIP